MDGVVYRVNYGTEVNIIFSNVFEFIRLVNKIKTTVWL